MKDERSSASPRATARAVVRAAGAPPSARSGPIPESAASPPADDGAREAQLRAEEAELVAALQGRDARKDAQAYERLVRTYGQPLLAVARQLLSCEADAHDVLQEAFLSIFLHIGSFAGDARLLTWMHRIVVNAALMRLRTQRRKAEQPIDELLPNYLEDGHQTRDTLPWRPTVCSELEDLQTRALVRGAIDRLPLSYRTVLVLRDIQELDTEETAKIMGLTQGAVKVRLHRARQALRTLLEPHFIDPETGRELGLEIGLELGPALKDEKDPKDQGQGA